MDRKLHLPEDWRSFMNSTIPSKTQYPEEQTRLLELMEILEAQTNQRSSTVMKLEQHKRQLEDILATEKSQLVQAMDAISRGEELCFPLWIDEAETDSGNHENGLSSECQTTTKEGGSN
jgi:hypothetical protein